MGQFMDCNNSETNTYKRQPIRFAANEQSYRLVKYIVIFMGQFMDCNNSETRIKGSETRIKGWLTNLKLHKWWQWTATLGLELS